jgi:hypothetical protein
LTLLQISFSVIQEIPVENLFSQNFRAIMIGKRILKKIKEKKEKHHLSLLR